MVRDIQTGFKYYFLISSWLQVYPDDEDETCLERTVEVASKINDVLSQHLLKRVELLLKYSYSC